MKRYRVEVCWEYTSIDWEWFEVEAENEEEARAAALVKAKDEGMCFPKSEIVDDKPEYTDGVELLEIVDRSGPDPDGRDFDNLGESPDF